MTIPIGTISNSKYSLRWRQPYVSESLNRKLSINSRGIVQGFKPKVGGLNSQIMIDPDDINGVSIAQLVGRAGSNQFTLTLRLNAVAMDLAAYVVPDKDYALIIRPNYVIGSPTNVEWELVEPADFDDALLNDVMVVAFLRTHPTDVAQPLAEVFVSGSAQSRGVSSQGWGRQSLMIDYAKMGAPSGADDGQMLELLYDSADADFDRFREFIEHYGPQGDVSTEHFVSLLRQDVIDMYALRSAGMMMPIAQSSGFGGLPDNQLFAQGYLNIADGPVSDGYPLGAVRIGGYDSTWYRAFVGPIGAGDPLVASSPLMNWYPCKPGDQFVVQMWLKSGGADTYPATPQDPTIMQGPNQTGLGAFWGGPARQYLDKLGVTGAQQSEEVHPLDPDQPVAYVHDKSWTLYRETFTCPADYDDVPIEYQGARWFSPFWKLCIQSEGHLLMAGLKVWKVRNGREMGHYDEYRLAHTADANPIGEAGRQPAQYPGRFSGGIVLNPQGTKVLEAAAAAQDMFDTMPWVMISQSPSTWDEIIGHSPNVPAFASLPPQRGQVSLYANPTPPAVGAPTHNLELLATDHTLREWTDSTVHEIATDPPGIWEHKLSGGMVLRAQPDPGLNALSDVRFALGDPPNSGGTWSWYDYPISPRWCVREDGSVESNAHNIAQQGAQLQASSDWGGKDRLYRSSDPPLLGLLGQRVATANLLGDPATLFTTGNNAYKGYEAGRDEYAASFHTPWSAIISPMAEYHIDLMCGTGSESVIGRISDSGPYVIPRALNLWSVAAIDPFWGVGGSTVLELVHDEFGPDCEVEDGQSVMWMGRMLGNGSGGAPWPFIAGGMALRRGATTQTLGPIGFRGDTVLSFYNSKAGLPKTFVAIDPLGCVHHSVSTTLDALPYDPGPMGQFPMRPGGDSICALNWLMTPAAVVYNYMPSNPDSVHENIRIDAAGRLYGDPTTFTEYHYYTPDPSHWDTGVEVGDCLSLSGLGIVNRTPSAQSPDVVGLFTVKQKQAKVMNSITGEITTDWWRDPATELPVDWATYVWDPERPPELIKVTDDDAAEICPVAAIGDNREFSDLEGTPSLPGFNVVNEGGDIAIGDLLQSSSTPGKLMKQADDVIHSYTVGKALQAVDFSGGAPSPTYGVYGILMCG